ncbi:phytolongin Phyl1.2-like isoform X1 [Lolium perenne]|nr:phytolongin Phyl1.1-like isoform X1 [Lolium perenne]
MISRRSKPRSLDSGPEVASPGMLDAAGVREGEGMGSSVFCCVAVTSRSKKGKQLSYFRSTAVGEEEAEAARALATLCLNHAPEHHRWHHHTVDRRRIFAFLAGDDGRTYLAIAEPTPGSAEVVQFLERVRDTCSATPRRQRNEAVSSVVQQFVQILQAGPSSSSTTHHMLPGTGGSFSEPSSADEEAQPEEGATQRRSSRPSWRHTWWRRHAMAVIGVDVVLCLVLFSVWMAVCHGFSCVQR